MSVRQSAQMSKITNEGLSRCGLHRMLYSCTHMATVDLKQLMTSRSFYSLFASQHF